MAPRVRQTAEVWDTVQGRLATIHEWSGYLGLEDFKVEARVLGVSAAAVEDHWTSYARRVDTAWSPTVDELATAASCPDFGCAIGCLRGVGVSAASAAIERALWRASSIAVGGLQRRERDRRRLRMAAA